VIYKYKCCEDAFANPWWCELDMEENQNTSPQVIHLCVDDSINTCATVWVDWVNWFYKASSCEDAYANPWFLGTTVYMEENQNVSPPVIHLCVGDTLNTCATVWVDWVNWFYKASSCKDAYANPWFLGTTVCMEENQNISPPVILLCVGDTINTCATVWVDWVNWFYKASCCKDAYANPWFLGTTVCMEENQNISPPVIHVSCSCRWFHLISSYCTCVTHTL
jgi:acyl-CoA synthetase (AMP-forming)/AMP-acid ligase II